VLLSRGSDGWNKGCPGGTPGRWNKEMLPQNNYKEILKYFIEYNIYRQAIL
jgi:hypothetical protein